MKKGLQGALALALVAGIATATGGSPPANEPGEWKPDPGYTALFNGKDLSGWKYYKETDLTGKTETGDKRFEVKDGVIVVNVKGFTVNKEGKKVETGGIKDLYTVKEYNKEFHLRMEFRAAPKADSGVYIRGPQLQVRDYPTVGPYNKVKFNSGDWNTLDITVKNGVVKTTVNGKTVGPKDYLELTVKDGQPVAKLNGKDVPVNDLKISVGSVAECRCNGEILDKAFPVGTKGGIGLQAETGKFEFRRIQIKEMP
jgi:hypothetical protein